jgi:hypothetical protein
MDASRLRDSSIRRPPKPLTLLPAHEIYLIREDLVRATHTETRTSYVNGKMTVQTVQVPNEYSELVIDFGNGIIMDCNNNLCVDLLRYHDLQLVDRFHVTGIPKGFSFASEDSYDLKDGVRRHATMNTDPMVIESGMLKFKRFVETNETGIILRGKFLGADVIKSARLVSPGAIEVKGFWKDTTFNMESPNLITMGKYFQIRTEGDHITVTYTGIFGMTTARTFFRTDTGFIFFDESNRGVEVLKEGNAILVMRSGKLRAEYRIELTE